MAPGARLLTYTLLIAWTFVVLFPLYWLLITSFKLPVQVNDGPDYLPFIDFAPSGHAWRYIFVELGNDTLRPYFNSLVIALVSTLLAVLFGALAAYALVRIRYRVKLGAVLAFLVILAGVITLTVAGFGVALADQPRRRRRPLPDLPLHWLRRASSARWATRTSSSGSSPTASCRRWWPCCRSTSCSSSCACWTPTSP